VAPPAHSAILAFPPNCHIHIHHIHTSRLVRPAPLVSPSLSTVTLDLLFRNGFTNSQREYGRLLSRIVWPKRKSGGMEKREAVIPGSPGAMKLTGAPTAVIDKRRSGLNN
jgi:hypothetical protein